MKAPFAILMVVAGVAACAPRQTPEAERGVAMIDALHAKVPGAQVQRAWSNGTWTCGRFTIAGVEKGFFGQTPGALWVEGPDSEPYYGRAWIKFCSVEKPSFYKSGRIAAP